VIFLDTNVAIDLLGRRHPQVRRRYAEARAASLRPLLSSVALFELRFGAFLGERREANARVLDALLADGVEVVPFDAEDAREAGEIRAGLRKAGREIGPYDVLIAAQARRRGATLVTHNLKEFARVPGLVVVDWAAT
jgi:tRNA(fMet)-specific endonuclease VapC